MSDAMFSETNTTPTTTVPPRTAGMSLAQGNGVAFEGDHLIHDFRRQSELGERSSLWQTF